ncbi:MAG: discoidin domain-containing protein [Prevotella sp.]|nr:discoidin domain-containing protein [Prevotella sp.]
MKRHLFFSLALAAAMTASAQNLAIGGTATATSGTAGLAIDDNTGTRWESAQNDNQSWQLDLGEAKDFNTVQIVWEGAYGKSFTIKTGNEIDAEGNLINGEVVKTVTDQTLSGFPNTQTLKLDKAVNARYVRFDGISRGTPYGYSFWEFRVLNSTGEQTLTTFSVAPVNPDKSDAQLSATKVGTAIKLNINAKDQAGLDYPTDGIKYEVTAGAGTVSAEGLFTPTQKGLNEVKVTLGDKTATVKVFAYEGDNLALGKLYDNNPEATTPEVSFDGNWGNRGGSGNPADGHSWLAVDLGAYYTIDLVDLKQEQANAADFTIQFSEDGETWKNAYSKTGLPGLQGDVRTYFFDNTTDNKHVRYVRFDATKPATPYGVSVYEMAVYGSDKEEIADTQVPVIGTAELVSAGVDNAILKLNIADDQKKVSIEVSDKATGNILTATQVNTGEDTNLTINGLNPGTTYTLSIVAKDAQNTSEPKEMSVSTTSMTAAPAPTVDAAKVLSVYSDTYDSATPALNFDAWGSTTQFEKMTIDGNNTLKFTNLNYYGMVLGTQLDVKDMTKLHLDIYAAADGNVDIVPIWWNAAANANFKEITRSVAVKANTWTSVDIDMNDFASDDRNGTSLVHQIKLANGNGNNIYVDNIYFANDGTVTPPVQTELTLVDVTDQGIAELEGKWDAEKFAAIDNEKQAAAYDLTKVTNLGTAVAPATKNPNALMVVTKVNSFNKNELVKQADGTYKASGVVEFNDGNDVCTAYNFTVNTNSGFYHRILPNGPAVSTAVVPFTMAVPADIKAYAAESQEEKDGTLSIIFKEVTEIQAGVPYLLKPQTGGIHFLNYTGNVDFTIHNNGAFKATYTTIANTTAEQKLYVVPAGTSNDKETIAFNHSVGGNIPAWRAYIDLSGTPSAAKVNIFFSTTNGIRTATTEELGQLFNIYSIDGKLVKQNASSAIGLAKGIYIMNGKKIVVR